MSKRAGEAGNIGPLIEQLGPLNNQWRQAGPPARVLTLWDMGEVILTHVADPSDALLWEVQQRSYITRTVLRYALIVRRGWRRRSTLEEIVRNLRSYTVFREALPFLKGDREGIDESTQRKVLALLSDSDTRAATDFLRRLKGQAIGRKHKKGAAVESLRNQAAAFTVALNELETAAGEGTRPAFDLDALLALSQMAMTAATSETSKAAPPAAAKADGPLAVIAAALTAALAGGRAGLAAFRKIVGAERLMAAADFLNSLRSDDGVADWRRRRFSKFSVTR